MSTTSLLCNSSTSSVATNIMTRRLVSSHWNDRSRRRRRRKTEEEKKKKDGRLCPNIKIIVLTYCYYEGIHYPIPLLLLVGHERTLRNPCNDVTNQATVVHHPRTQYTVRRSHGTGRRRSIMTVVSVLVVNTQKQKGGRNERVNSPGCAGNVRTYGSS